MLMIEHDYHGFRGSNLQRQIAPQENQGIEIPWNLGEAGPSSWKRPPWAVAASMIDGPWQARPTAYQVTVTVFEQVEVPASHTW
jgi:hypothetical protein